MYGPCDLSKSNLQTPQAFDAVAFANYFIKEHT